MALLRSVLTLTGVFSLVQLHGSQTAATPAPEDVQQTPTNAATFTPAQCLTDLNAARAAAGFPEFTASDALTQKLSASSEGGVAPTSSPFLTELCGLVETGQFAESDEGTYMYAEQSGSTADCPAAVEYWKGGFSLFTGDLPAAYTPDTRPYTDPLATSFVGLYNPGESPKVDCAFITCPIGTDAPSDGDQAKSRLRAVLPPQLAAAVSTGIEKAKALFTPAANAVRAQVSSNMPNTTDIRRAQEATKENAEVPEAVKSFIEAAASAASSLPADALTKAQPAVADAAQSLKAAAAAAAGFLEKELGAEGAKTRRLESATAVNTLVCYTTPAALKTGQQPFTGDQWAKIAGSVSGSSSAQIPAFLLIALVSLTIAAF